MESSLQPTDPFYQKQKGPPPFCGAGDVAQLASLIQRHEALHWTEAHARVTPLQTETALERTVEFPGTSTLAGDVSAAISAYANAITGANSAVENTLLPVQPNAPVCQMRP